MYSVESSKDLQNTNKKFDGLKAVSCIESKTAEKMKPTVKSI